MRRMIYACLVVFAAVTLLHAQAAPEPVQAARAMLVRPSSIADRVARAESIVTGKVTSIEDKTVSVAPVPGAKDKVEYLVAVVKIDDDIQGAKGLTHIKVGFAAPQNVAGGVRPIRVGGGQAKLDKDQEVLLFLTPHHTGEFEVMQAYFDVVDKNATTFEKDLEAAKKYAKLLADPEKSLKSKDAEERLATASMLITKYRTPHPSATPPKEEPIDAARSKLILAALADADWSPAKPGAANVNYDLMPLNIFFRLGVTDKDGWKPRQLKAANELADAAHEWVKQNKDTYRIKQFVAEKDK